MSFPARQICPLAVIVGSRGINDSFNPAYEPGCRLGERDARLVPDPKWAQHVEHVLGSDVPHLDVAKDREGVGLKRALPLRSVLGVAPAALEAAIYSSAA